MARFLFFVFVTVLFCLGCGESVEEKAMEERIEEATGGEADVDLSEKAMKVTGETEDGQYSISAGESIEIPGDFPTDVLLYSPSKTVMAMKVPEGHSVSLSTDNSVAAVAKAYQQEMKAKGWSEATVMNMGEQSVLMYKKEDRVANISIAQVSGATQISVTVAKD